LSLCFVTLNSDGVKQGAMHKATCWGLQAVHNPHVNQSLAGMSAKLGLVMDRLGSIKI